MSNIKAYMNWSGGKDSSLCLYKILQSHQYDVKHLLTSVNAVHDRISMHGVRRALLQSQARSIGIPLRTIELPEQPGMSEYEQQMMSAVQYLKEDGCTHSIFGDIYLEDLRRYRENKLQESGVNCVFPLWQQNTTALAKEFIDLGFKSIIVCVNDRYLDKTFCGRLIDYSLLSDLPPDVDPCGENGEYHSFVFNGPIFHEPVIFEKGEVVMKKYRAPQGNDDCHTHTDPAQNGFYFCDLLPVN